MERVVVLVKDGKVQEIYSNSESVVVDMIELKPTSPGERILIDLAVDAIKSNPNYKKVK